MNRVLRNSVCLVGMVVFGLSATTAAEVDTIYQLVEQQKWQQALSQTEVELAKSPGDVQLLFVKGLVLAESGSTDKAIMLFETMSKAHPQLPEPYNNLAVLYARQQKFDKAINALKQAIQTHPSYATAHENLGDLYARMASMAYGKARILDQKNESAETKLALIQRFFSDENSDTEAMDSGVPKVTKESDPPGESAAINEVVDRLNNWATAWSAQDMDSYASAYADEFNPPGGQSRASWSMQRRDRLNRPDFIKVVLSGFEVEMVATDRAEVRLTQRYKSDRYSDTTRKKMILVQQSDGWKILEEYSLR